MSIQVTSPTQRMQTISILSNFRQEWEKAGNGKSLLEVEGNIGLVLADMVNAFGFSTQEQTLLLGPELFDEMREILDQPSKN